MKTSLIVIIIAAVVSLIITTDLTGNNTDVLVLSDKTTVSLNTPITEDSVKDIQVELMEKSQKLGGSTPIILVLNSPGGSIDAGFKLIETARGLKQSVDTLSLFSASMSFITSQYLNKRYVTATSTLMSHRAYLGGVEGQVPGSFITRTNNILEALVNIDKFIAGRAKVPVADYEKAISNELWMDGEKSMSMGFGDKLIKVRCDQSLQGAGKEKTINIMMFTIKVVYHKCPLVTEPLSVDINNGQLTSQADYIWNLYLNDKPRFIEEYVVNGKFNQFVR